ncbi:hypothetical protein GAYE_SCF22MG4210 [Galdieria yellowstonensis]|uniref:Uncharacterized protein n=1 Tax=Galdieria yellowstonensis TaxID=3028027 RepID=A0AAV9IGE4_9RHOD|nr:hypothetical protein GAYE_SCF22MG4210 [Galdieria yellowstonensis]
MVVFGPFSWKTKSGNRITIFGAFFTLPLMGYSLWQYFQPVSPVISKSRTEEPKETLLLDDSSSSSWKDSNTRF